MAVPVREFTDVAYLQRVVMHLYDLLNAIDTAGYMAKSDDVMYRKIVENIQKRKNDSGVSSPDGYSLKISECQFAIKE